MERYFASSYETSREIFVQSKEKLSKVWESVEHIREQHPDDPSLSTDFLFCSPPYKKRLVVLSSGLHGIEGYVGAAVIQLFIQEMLDEVENETTGLLLIHAVNPWGMKYERKVNENNVDLNRNFVWNWTTDSLQNPDYKELQQFFHPSKLDWFTFGGELARTLFKHGSARLQRALTLGQYEDPQGVYYGGKSYQLQTRSMIKCLHAIFQQYEEIIYLDLHSGYGPTQQMSLVNSPYEEIAAAEWKERLHYPNIVNTTKEEFYEIHGDLINYIYLLQKEVYPDVKLYATALEFGTLGDSTWALIQSLKTTIDENVVYQEGTSELKSRVKRKLREMYFPALSVWRNRALENARVALRGILSLNFDF